MKRLLWILLLIAAGGLPIFAQNPDCTIGFNLTATGQRSVVTGCGHNLTGIIEWRVVYTNVGFTGPFSLRLESSADNMTWVAFVGTLNDGTNPATSTTYGTIDMDGFNPYVSVALNTAGGSGTVSGVLYGCKEPGCANFPGGGSGGGGAVISCPLRVPITVTAATDQRIITGVASTNIKLCQIVFSGAVTADVTIEQGTGTNCGTNTLALTGAIGNTLGLALDINSNGGTINTTILARDMCLHFSTAVTSGGYALYQQN
jgi:hypothetical protein